MNKISSTYQSKLYIRLENIYTEVFQPVLIFQSVNNVLSEK